MDTESLIKLAHDIHKYLIPALATVETPPKAAGRVDQLDTDVAESWGENFDMMMDYLRKVSIGDYDADSPLANVYEDFQQELRALPGSHEEGDNYGIEKEDDQFKFEGPGDGMLTANPTNLDQEQVADAVYFIMATVLLLHDRLYSDIA